MITLEEAKEQLLFQIDFELCRKHIYNVHIECIGDEVRIYKVDDKEDSPEQFISRLPDGDLIDQAFDSAN